MVRRGSWVQVPLRALDRIRARIARQAPGRSTPPPGAHPPDRCTALSPMRLASPPGRADRDGPLRAAGRARADRACAPSAAATSSSVPARPTPTSSSAPSTASTTCRSAELAAPRLIWDLGANIGLTMRQMAAAFPAARIDRRRARPRPTSSSPAATWRRSPSGPSWSRGPSGPSRARLSYGLPAGRGRGLLPRRRGRRGHRRRGHPRRAARALRRPRLREDGHRGRRARRARAATPPGPPRSPGSASSTTLPTRSRDCESDAPRRSASTGFEVHRRGLLRRGSDSLYAFRASSPSAR